jgi:tellurite resistance protein TehA-like permease
VTEEPAPAPPDPWKSFRGVMAGTLILESIVVLLALPVVSVVGGGLSAGSTAYLVGVAVVLILMAGVQGRPWALKANIGIQFVLVAGAFIHITIGFIGVLFVLVWVLIAYLKAEVKRRQERGLLPGQQPPPSD